MKSIRYYYHTFYLKACVPAVIFGMLISTYHTQNRVRENIKNVQNSITYRTQILVYQELENIITQIRFYSEVITASADSIALKFKFSKNFHQNSLLHEFREKLKETLPESIFQHIDILINENISQLVSNTAFLLSTSLDTFTIFIPLYFDPESGLARTMLIKKLDENTSLLIQLRINPEFYQPRLAKIKLLSIYLEDAAVCTENLTPIFDNSPKNFKSRSLPFRKILKIPVNLEVSGEKLQAIYIYLLMNFIPLHNLILLNLISFLTLLVLLHFISVSDMRDINRNLSAFEKFLNQCANGNCELPKKEETGLQEFKKITKIVTEAVKHLQIEQRKSIELLNTIEDTFFDFAEKFAVIAEGYEHETGEHLKRVKILTELIVNRLDLDITYAREIINFSILHDIGKLYIPYDTLTKPGKVDTNEWESVKLHTIYARKLLTHPNFKTALEIALYHHENYDGTGYPFGLKGEDIPLPGRIIKIVDVYDALRSQRPYKKPYSHEEAINIMLRGDERTKPQHFDPVILKIFIEEISKKENLEKLKYE
ncbi:MAG: HD-GYP domain-containing protein [Candidatus Hydrothermia bacterium]